MPPEPGDDDRRILSSTYTGARLGAVVAVLAGAAATGTWRHWRRAALVGILVALIWLVVDAYLR